RRKLCSISVQPSTRGASSSAASPEVKSAVNPRGLADPLLEWAETAIALHLVLEWSPCLPQRSVLAPKARRSKSRRRGNAKGARPAALASRGHRRRLCREGQRRAKARLFLRR